jgi:outer membrane receptor protein involved in Fe transport
MRVQYESKDARWDNDVSDNAVALRAAAFENFTLKRDLSNVEFAPKVGLKYRWTDDFQLFTTWSRGFRTGGFNSSVANADNPEQVEFKSESVASWEVGAKTEFLHGTARLDLTLYNMTLKDFQLSTNLPTGVFSIPAVQNAGEVRARGIEADGTWLPTDWLTFRGAMAFNDTELLKFPFGVCEADRPNSDGDEDPRCDLSGGPLQNAPKWTMTMTPQIIYPLSLLPGLQRRAPVLDGIELRGGLSVEYVDTHFLRESLDPRTRQGSFFRLNANIGLASPGSGWDLSFTVDNLTDESVSTFVTIPVVNTVRDTFLQFPDPPRLVFGSLRWSF